MFRRILFPTDFSDYARRVMDCIADLPGVMEVVMVHIVGTNKPASLRSDMVSSARTRIESEATLLKILEFHQSEQKLWCLNLLPPG